MPPLKIGYELQYGELIAICQARLLIHRLIYMSQR